jgi:hypothetical protein
VAKNKAKFSIDIILKFLALSVVQSDAAGIFKNITS